MTPAVLVEEEVVLEDDDGLSPEERKLAQTLVDIENEAPIDTGEQAHDDKVIKSTGDRAISEMRLRRPAVKKDHRRGKQENVWYISKGVFSSHIDDDEGIINLVGGRSRPSR